MKENILAVLFIARHRKSIEHPYAIIWLDDASRYILAGGEFREATTEYSILTFKEARVIKNLKI